MNMFSLLPLFALFGAVVLATKDQELATACLEGQLVEVKRLIEEVGVSVEARSNDGATPIIKAAQGENSAVVSYLISKDANVEARDLGGSTPLITAAFNGRTETVRVLLDTKKVDINERNGDGSTALISAAFTGKTDTCKLLMDSGANVHMINYSGTSAYRAAKYSNYMDTAKAIKDHGGDGSTAQHCTIGLLIGCLILTFLL